MNLTLDEYLRIYKIDRKRLCIDAKYFSETMNSFDDKRYSMSDQSLKEKSKNMTHDIEVKFNEIENDLEIHWSEDIEEKKAIKVFSEIQKLVIDNDLDVDSVIFKINIK